MNSPEPGSTTEDLARAAARAATRRVLGGRVGEASSGVGSPDLDRAAEGGAARPGSDRVGRPSTPTRPRGPALVDVEALERVPVGGWLELDSAALVTPLAREEARRRGIRLGSGGALRRPSGVRSVAVGCDHGGFALKQDVLASLRELGARPIDFGTRDTRSVDYPDFARAVAEAVASGQCELGVVIDGAGIGSAIAANKVPGARAATCTDERMAANAREHNHANVLSIGAGWLSASQAHGVLRAFLTSEPGPDRHARRARKIDAIEARYARGADRRGGVHGGRA